MTQLTSIIRVVGVCAALVAVATSGRSVGSGWLSMAANAQPAGDEKAATSEKGSGQDKKRTPEEIMQARFPQPVKAGHLIGLPILDSDDSTIGYVKAVVRSPDGKIRLVMPYGRRLGWAGDWWPANAGRRLVAVPIEVVAILALQIDALDMARPDFDTAPTWTAGLDKPVPLEETLKIALGRR